MADRCQPVQARGVRPPPGSKDVAASELTFGPRILELADRLAVHSELPGALACTYLTPAHRATAQELAQWMRDAGMAVEIHGGANGVGRYAAARPAQNLLVRSHHHAVVLCPQHH